MKKKEKALIIFMIITVIFGALLPQGVLSFMDNKIVSKTEKKKMEHISFSNSSSLMDSLKLMSESYTEYDIKSNDLNYTSKEIFKKSREIIRKLGKYFEPISLEDVSSHIETPAFIVSDDNDIEVSEQGGEEQKIVLLKSTIWICNIITKSEKNFIIYIDDSTGSMVRIFCYNYSDNIVNVDFQDCYKKFLKFCRAYYDFEVLEVKDTISSDSTYAVRNYGGLENYLILNDKTSNESVKVLLYVNYGILQFNAGDFYG